MLVRLARISLYKRQIWDLLHHAMEGFDYERAREVVNIPEHFEIEAMIAIGYPTEVLTSSLAEENYDVRSE